jgi:large subunit ribosomal protein L21
MLGSGYLKIGKTKFPNTCTASTEYLNTMSYAIIETGGKQYRVEVGRFYDVELLEAEPDSKLTIDKVFFVNMDGDITIGQPLVDSATVEVTVMRHHKAKKVIVYKMRPKKKTRRKNGHRQPLTRIMVEAINLSAQAA